MLSYIGFLHDHPAVQCTKEIDYGHVVVDVEDWRMVRKITEQKPKDIQIALISGYLNMAKRAITKNVEPECAIKCINNALSLLSPNDIVE